MSKGPQRLVLIRSGLYEFAEVELAGALQIVGPNNTGKTTLINTLQFLYLNDRRHMDFGSYTAEQTRDFYFPSQYSYILFECLGATGHCVVGWRGQSKTSGGEPERFCYFGPFDASDFVNERQQVREARDVNARLALKQFRVIKSAEEHRELLLPARSNDGRGVGIVALRDPDKYHHFRETLKNLLTLSAITQEQMRDRLLMLADIPPDRTAFDARQLFGDDYDKIRKRREELLNFKKNQGLVERLVGRFADREGIRGEMVWRWTDLRAKKQKFETDHELNIDSLRAEASKQEALFRQFEAELVDRRKDVAVFSEEKGAVAAKIAEIDCLSKQFGGFAEEMERAALVNLNREVRAIENQMADAERESRENAKQKIQLFDGLVAQQEQTIARFDTLAVTALRKHFSDVELNTVFRLLNRDLLQVPVGEQGIVVSREKELLATIGELLSRVKDGTYADGNVAIPLPTGIAPLANLENVHAARAQLAEYRDALNRWQKILSAIEQREKLEADLRRARAEVDAKSRLIFQFEEFQKAKAEEPRLRAELKKIAETIEAAEKAVAKLVDQSKNAEKAQREAEGSKIKAEDEFNRVMGEFNQCLFPDFGTKPCAVEDIPNDFGAAIALYLRQQETQDRLSGEIGNLLAETERWFGDQFLGEDERETIGNLREELDALTEKEEALARDWNAHLHGLKATFDLVIRNMGHVASAATDITRAFSKVRVSNLKCIKLEVIEQSDLMSWIKRLAAFEPGGLFDNDPQQESAIVNFRTKIQNNPVIRFADLFTLGVTVTGADDRRHFYSDFRQIESHGTTITIKVLFNLLLLKNQLRGEDCAVPFFLDEIQALDPANRHAILSTARQLGFVAITAAPEAVSEVDTLYFLQPQNGKIILRNKHRVAVKRTGALVSR